MSIEAIKYAARQISKHFEMLNKEDYRKARFNKFREWHELITERIAKGEIAGPTNIFYNTYIDSFPVSETLPKGYSFHFGEEWSYAPIKLNHQIAIVKTIKQINWDKLIAKDIPLSYKIFRADITTDTIDKWRHSDLKIQKLLRPIPKLLKHYTMNTIVVTNKTSYEDILMQLIILALKDEFIDIGKEVMDICRSYIRRKIWLSGYDRRFIKDLLYLKKDETPQRYLSIGDILIHLSNNYIRPYNAFTFRFYLKSIIKGLYKTERRKERIIIPRELKTMQYQDAMTNETLDKESLFQESLDEKPEVSETHLKDILTESTNESYIFYDKKGREIGIGVDRAAIEFGTSRDKIYRLIRKGQIKVKKIDDTYVLDDQTQKKLLEVLQKKQTYQKLISDLSFKREIKPNSARKLIRRKQKKKNLTIL